MIKPMYKLGTTANTIIMDGWVRAFKVEQTVVELRAQGLFYTAKQVKKFWDAENLKFKEGETSYDTDNN